MIKPKIVEDKTPYFTYHFQDNKITVADHGYNDLFMANLGVHIVKYIHGGNFAYYWALEDKEAEINTLYKDMEEIYDIYLGTMPKSWHNNIAEIRSKFKKDWLNKYWEADNKYRAPDNWYKNKFNQLYFSPFMAGEWNYNIRQKLGREIKLL